MSELPDEADEGGEARPRIDVSEALGEGGHEVEYLGYEGVPDTGPVLKQPEESQLDEEIELDRVVNEFPAD